jgi:hypothetical protein
LREAGWDSEIFEGRHADAYDLVVFQKIYDDSAIELARSLRTRGIVTVFDLCDNHFFNPDCLPALTERAVRLERMLDTVDAVSVSSEPLRELLAGRQCEAVVIDDAFDVLPTGEPPSSKLRGWHRLGRKTNTKRLRLVWFGNAGLGSPPFGLVHLPKILPLLDEVDVDFPLNLTVISNSRRKYEEAVAGARIQTRYIEWGLAEFPTVFQQHDICVIPIEINPFTVCKTANRVALSLWLGVPVIADPIPSFQEFSRFILLDDWAVNLERYASTPALRMRHAEEGRAYVATTHTKARVISQWSDFFTRLLSTSGRTPTGSRKGLPTP